MQFACTVLYEKQSIIIIKLSHIHKEIIVLDRVRTCRPQMFGDEEECSLKIHEQRRSSYEFRVLDRFPIVTMKILCISKYWFDKPFWN